MAMADAGAEILHVEKGCLKHSFLLVADKCQLLPCYVFTISKRSL